EGQLSSPMRTITSSTSSSASSWMSRPAVPFARQRSVQLRRWSGGRRGVWGQEAWIARREDVVDITPAYLAADTAYGSADTLNWVVNEKKIVPHIPVIDKSKREDGTFSREGFRCDQK